MKRILFLFVGLFTLFSCAVDDVDTASSDDYTNFTTDSNQYSISEEEALANLYAFMGEGGDSRSSDNRVVNSVVPIKYNSLGTRAVEGVDCENLLYIANFENEEGYAILAGDTRIDDEVIAITDRGSLESEVLNNIIVEWEDGERPHFEGYPTTGPGFFTTPETGDELFMNPNTVNLFVDEEQDTLVGDFDLSLYSDNGGNNISQDTEYQFPEALSLSLCTSYAMREIIEFNPNPREDFDGGDNNTRIDVTYSPWVDTKITTSILDPYVSWHQEKPFNDLFPTVREYIVIGRSRVAPAGCFPLALAKILAHFEYPVNIVYKNNVVYWDRLKENYNSVLGSKSAATLLKWISDACDSWPFYQGTFTFPYRVRDFMSYLEIDNVHIHSYSFDRVEYMIDRGLPLLIYAMPNLRFWESHAWNIDGYKIKQRTKTTKLYVDNVLEETTNSIEIRKMPHCDFGWQGSANGYYASGIFDLRSSYAELDWGNHNRTDNYNKYLHVITYSLPQ